MQSKNDKRVTVDSAAERRKQGLSRRRFLGWTAALGAAGAAYAGLPGLFRGLSRAEASEITDYSKGGWIPSNCMMCGGQCGIQCFVDSAGVLRKIEPARDPGNVASISTAFAAQLALAGDDFEHGTLCCRGNSGRRSLYDPDRLQSPMKRVGPRGEATSFVPISWDEAISLCADGLRSVAGNYGPRAIEWFSDSKPTAFTSSRVPKGRLSGSPLARAYTRERWALENGAASLSLSMKYWRISGRTNSSMKRM